MTSLDKYRKALAAVTMQRCGFGGDDRGYCGVPATTHLWLINWPPGHPDGYTMSCDAHCAWFDTRRELVHDHHPVGGACALPDTDWVFSHPAAGPGWCEMPEMDWLVAIERIEAPVEAVTGS